MRTSPPPAGGDCSPLYDSRWPAVGKQWRLAQEALSLGGEFPSAVPTLELPRNGVDECRGSLADLNVSYLPVFQASSKALCLHVGGMMSEALPPSRRFAFTFVREPLSHFVAGYAEIANRALTVGQHHYNGSCAACYSFVSALDTPDAAARAFLRDMLRGCIASPCCTPTSPVWSDADLHILPQAAFISHQQAKGRGPLNYIGRVEELNADWASIGDILPGWPPFNSSSSIGRGSPLCDNHMKTCESPSLVHGRAMQDLLSRDRKALLAVCRMMLMDYGCLNALYELPVGCKEIPLNEVIRSCPRKLKSFVEESLTSPGYSRAVVASERFGGARLAETKAPRAHVAKTPKVLFLTRGHFKSWLERKRFVEMGARGMAASRRAAAALNHKLDVGLLARTFECYGLISEGANFSASSFLEQCALKEIGNHAGRSWEANGKASERFKPAVVLHESTPRTAYPNSLVRWDWDHGSFAKSLCFGLILSLPPRSLRGPFWPHDAWVSSEVSWKATRAQCVKGVDSPSQYASRRMEYFRSMDSARAFHERCSDEAKEHASTSPAQGCVALRSFCQKIIYEHALASNLTCWSDDWHAGLRRQSTFWKMEYDETNKSRKPFARTQGCERGSLWNQAMFLKEHVRPRTVAAIFYANISGGGDPSRKSNASELIRTAEYSFRVAFHIHQLYRRTRGLTIPIVQLIADGKIAGSQAFEPI
ncbi:MAG: hypothetical protein SGPRY_013562 [Prymnesium sp.]